MSRPDLSSIVVLSGDVCEGHHGGELAQVHIYIVVAHDEEVHPDLAESLLECR